MIIGRMRLFLVESPIRMARAQGVGSVKGSVKRVLIALSTDDGLTGWGEAAPWEVFTGTPGVFVKLEDTIRSFAGIVEGKYDHLPEAAFYMVGTIEEAVKKAEGLKQAA